MRVTQLAFLSCIVSASLGVLAAACGQTNTNDGPSPGAEAGADVVAPPADAGTPGDADAADAPVYPYPAKAPVDPPQVMTLGGPVMTAPKIVPIFFANDPDKTTQMSVADFVSKVGHTNFWKAVTTEYGVGAATGLTPIVLTAEDNPPAMLDDSAIEPWLAAKLNSNDPAWPKPDGNTLYALFYPATTTITLGGDAGAPGNDAGPDAGSDDAAAADGGTPDTGTAPPADAGGVDGGGPPGGGVETSCVYFGGYHQNIQLDQNHDFLDVAYAVLPRCPGYDGLSALDTLTSAASHEFLEAATDPFPVDTPAYYTADYANFYWASFLGGGEIGDMCAQFQSSFTKFPDMPLYEVQRSWSNKAAKAGQEPCVPALAGEVYFNTVPVMTLVPTSYEGMTVTAWGAQIAMGASKTIPLNLFSTAPTSGPWTVSATDTAAAAGRPAELAFTFDKTTGQNGDTIQMTVKVVAASKRNRETFIVQSQLGTQTNIWLGIVVN